jgi:hypothetical protein
VAVLLLVALAPALLAACGGGSPSISDDAAAELHTRVAAVRVAVDAHDPDAAARALDALHTAVDRFRAAGDLSGARATEIRAAAGAVRTQLVTITTTTTTPTTTTTTTPAPTPSTKGPTKGPTNGKDKHAGEDDQGRGAGERGKGSR